MVEKVVVVVVVVVVDASEILAVKHQLIRENICKTS